MIKVLSNYWYIKIYLNAFHDNWGEKTVLMSLESLRFVSSSWRLYCSSAGDVVWKAERKERKIGFNCNILCDIESESIFICKVT